MTEEQIREIIRSELMQQRASEPGFQFVFNAVSALAEKLTGEKMVVSACIGGNQVLRIKSPSGAVEWLTPAVADSAGQRPE